MIKGIDLLTHPDAEEVILYEGYDSFMAGQFYGDLIGRSTFKTDQKEYKILNLVVNTSIPNKWIVSFIGIPV